MPVERSINGDRMHGNTMARDRWRTAGVTRKAVPSGTTRHNGYRTRTKTRAESRTSSDHQKTLNNSPQPLLNTMVPRASRGDLSYPTHPPCLNPRARSLRLDKAAIGFSRGLALIQPTER